MRSSRRNNATTQVALLILINTAVIGNYSDVNVGVKVPGILARGTYNGTAVNPCCRTSAAAWQARIMAGIVVRCRTVWTVVAQAR